MLSRSLYLLLRLVLPAVVGAAMLLAGATFVMMQPKLYEAHAKLWIQALDRMQAQESVYRPLTTFFNNPIVTSCELLKSDFVLKTAGDLLAQRDPKYRNFDTSSISGKLKAEGIKQTDLVVISYTNPDPKTSAAVVQAILDAFIQVSMGEGAGHQHHKVDLLKEELAQAKKDYAESRRKLRDYKSTVHTVSVDQDNTQLLQTIRDLEYGINMSRVEVAKTQSVVTALQEQLKDKNGAVARYKAVSSDTLALALKDKIADYQVQLIEAKSKYQSNHPRIHKLEQNIEQTKKALAKRISEMLAKVDESDDYSDEATSGLVTELSKAKAENRAAQLALAYQQEALQQQRAHRNDLPMHQEQLLELERSVQFQERRVSDLQADLDHTQIVGSSARPTNIQVVDFPQVPTSPTTNAVNQLLLVAVLSAVLAGLTYVGMVFADPALDNVNLLRRLFNAHLYAGFNPVPGKDSPPQSLRTIHLLRYGIRHWLSSFTKRIVVTSPNENDGKTAIAVSLALAYARSGKSVALVDGNFQAPSLHHTFKVSPGAGWYACLKGDKRVEEVAVPVEENLMLLPLPEALTRVGAFFESPQFEKFIRELEQRCDVVIFDTPAVVDYPESLAMLGQKSCLMIVVRYHHTLKKSLRLVSTGLQRMGGNTKVAVVVNDIDEHLLSHKTNEEEETEPDSAMEAVL